jgi:PmbA protein
MARDFPNFDTWHPWDIHADQAVDLALAAEQAGREADPRIDNSDGASVSSSLALSVYANSHGFIGADRGSSHSLSCSLIAGRGDAMQRDYWYDAGSCADDLQGPAEIGRIAAGRAVARLDPRPLRTGEFPVLFAAEVARSLFGHLIGAASGGALFRRASFLLDKLGSRILPEGIDLIERPHLIRGHRSASYDAEGVVTRDNPLVENGILARYVLGSYSARRLGMATTANAGGIHNLEVSCGGDDRAALIRSIGRGLLVTELMGQGVNLITGDYSRGAAGFWIENGEIAYPVDEVTIAGKLPDMLLAIEAIGSDVDRRSHIGTGSVLIGRMTVAGSA